MKINNPFESGEIKNYILLYAGVVTIVILFFFAVTLFQEKKEKVEKKSFHTDNPTLKKLQEGEKKGTTKEEKKFQLLNINY